MRLDENKLRIVAGNGVSGVQQPIPCVIGTGFWDAEWTAFVLGKRGNRTICSTMAWERRGNFQYYYKNERQGSHVRSLYVGRGEIAHMVSQLQSGSPVVERLARNNKSAELIKFEHAEAGLEQATDLIRLATDATLLAAGFHTHHRQWRRTRNGDGS